MNNRVFLRFASILLVVCVMVTSVYAPVKADPVTGIYVNGVEEPAEGKTPNVYSLGISSSLPYRTMLVRTALQEVNYYHKMYVGENAYDPAFVDSLDSAAYLLWYKSTDQINWQAMGAGETFASGYYYKAKFYIQLDNCDDAASERLPVYLDGAAVEGNYRNRNELPYGGPVEINFSNLAIKTLSVFGVDEIVEPVAGEKPNFSSAYLYSSSCSIMNQKEFWNWYISYGKSHTGSEYFDSFTDNFTQALPSDAKVMWLESKDGKNWEYMIDRKTGEISNFEYGKYYMVDIIIDIPEQGVEVGQWAWAYVNSKENVADFDPFTKSPSNDYEIQYVFDALVENPSPEAPEETTQEVEIENLRFTAPAEWTLDENGKQTGEIILYHGKNEADASSMLKVQMLDASQVEKNVKEGASLSETTYQFVKSQAAKEGTKIKILYAIPEYEMNGMYVSRIVALQLKAGDNENLFTAADASEERPLIQYLMVKLNGKYYRLSFTNYKNDFVDQMSFDQILSTLQDMKNLSVRLEGQEFSNIMGYLQAARYSYGIDEDGQKLYSNVLEIRNLNKNAINTSAVFNIYGTDEKGQEYLIKSGLKFYGMMGDKWWLNAGKDEITRVEFTEVISTEASNAVKCRMKANEDGSVITLIPEGAFNTKDVQIMLGADQFWDYPDTGSNAKIDLTQYKDKLESWQDYDAFTVNVILYNK